MTNNQTKSGICNLVIVFRLVIVIWLLVIHRGDYNAKL
jgi:hypothetical protein